MASTAENMPEYGVMRFFDWVVLFYTFIHFLVWDLPVFVLTYPYVYAGAAPGSFGTNLQCALVRSANNNLTDTGIRFSQRPPAEVASAVLQSPRYGPYRQNLYHPVSRPEFTGYWVIQHAFKAIEPPSGSDIVIFYLHGGGYVCSRPAHYLLFLLRLAETILEQGLSLSIFALDYSLAPEHSFPTQLDEAIATYEYLLTEANVPAEKVVLTGDSAGGHLALSLLVKLAVDRKNSKSVTTSTAAHKPLAIPQSLALISPWLSFHNEPSTYTTNTHLDFLTPSLIRRFAPLFLGTGRGHEGMKHLDINSPLVEFLTPDPPIDWNDVLPSSVWVCVGANEMFVGAVRWWVKSIEEQRVRDRVSVDIGVGKAHVWQYMETQMDRGMKERFLKAEVGDRRGFKETAKVGQAILTMMRRKS